MSIEKLLREKPKLELVETGQPVDQFKDNQLASVVSQSASQPDDQLTSQPVDQIAKYPSRRLRKQKGLRLPVQKLQKWELWCFMNKVDFQDAVEQAMDWLTSQPVNHVLIDDFEDIGTTDDVLIYYHKWTGNKITEKDKEARESMKRFSDDICKIGIAISVYRAKTKINSFKYCTGAIEEAAEIPVPLNDTNGYLKYLETGLTKAK